jgi:hypothetical protein
MEDFFFLRDQVRLARGEMMEEKLFVQRQLQVSRATDLSGLGFSAAPLDLSTAFFHCQEYEGCKPRDVSGFSTMRIVLTCNRSCGKKTLSNIASRRVLVWEKERLKI